MGLYRGYEAATRPTDGPQPGARALMAWWLGAYGPRGGTNLGIYNVRTVRGGTTTSLHAEGRAADLGINPHGADYGDEIAELLRTRSADLGVQCVIWRRRIWSGAHPDAGWRAYQGTNPHLDHVHVELSRAAARDLAAARVAEVMRDLTPATPAAPPLEDLVQCFDWPAGVGRHKLICPVGKSSMLTKRAWLSLACDGDITALDVWIQGDTAGIAEYHERLPKDRRRWWELPDGTTQVVVHYEATGPVGAALELLPKP